MKRLLKKINLLSGFILLTLPSFNLFARELSFDFSRGSGDRQHQFGTHYPEDRGDYNGSARSFQVQGGDLKATTLSTAWILLDDEDPDNINDPASTNGSGLSAANATIRTRLTGLSSGDGGVAGSAGVLLGITTPGLSTANGYICSVDRIAGPNTGALHIDTFQNGVRSGNLAISSSYFSYGSSSATYFLEVRTAGKTCTVKLFADASISGSETDLSRLTSADFETATPTASLTVELPDYTGGLAGLYFEDTGASGNNGGVRFHNFYIDRDGATIDPDNPPMLQTLASLSNASDWSVTSGSTALSLTNYQEYLQLEFDASTGSTATMELNTPVLIPDWATDFTFTTLADTHSAQIRLDVIIEDSVGNEYAFKTKIPYNNEYLGDINIFNTAVQSGRKYRFSLPGLLSMDMDANPSKGNLTPLTNNVLPVRPYTLKGLAFEGVSQLSTISDTHLYAKDFALTGINGNSSSLYYNFNDLEFFGELDPVPHLMLGDLWDWRGTADARVSWDIRDGYDRLPFLSGSPS
jgi:hypothetical protein